MILGVRGKMGVRAEMNNEWCLDSFTKAELAVYIFTDVDFLPYLTVI